MTEEVTFCTDSQQSLDETPFGVQENGVSSVLIITERQQRK